MRHKARRVFVFYIEYNHTKGMKMYSLILKLVFLTLVIIPSAYAQEANQEAQESPSFVTPNSVQFGEDSFKVAPEARELQQDQIFVSDEPDITVIEDQYVGQYLVPSVENLSKLYWKKNTLDIENNEAVDNFLKINECEIYEEYYEDDFEWKRVRDAAKKMLNQNKADFPDKFKFILPVDLGRYDLEKKGFPLVSETAFVDLRRVEMGGGDNQKDICGTTLDIDYYPRNIVLALSNPFNFDFLQIDEHVAQAFIIRRKYEKAETGNELRLRHYKRPVFARLRVHLTSYQGQTRGRDNNSLAVMFGRIEGIDFFEDPYEKKLLKSVDFTD